MRLHARHKESAKENVAPLTNPQGIAAGKVILLGEHAVVYGRHALAIPIRNAVTASVTDSGDDDAPPRHAGILSVIRQELALEDDAFGVAVRCTLPSGMGLGSSAAVAVAIIRAISVARDLGLDDERVNRIALKCERLAHGTPSGIDNSLATYAMPMLFSNADGLHIEKLELPEWLPIVIAFSHQAGLTHEQVAGVSARYAANREHYAAIFDQIDALSLAGATALRNADYAGLGALMNINHGLLNALEVSTPDIESIVSIARSSGAIGAKLTGGGGGGSVVALCPGRVDDVRHALTAAGYNSLTLTNAKEQ